jgi:capsid portal protein
MAGADPAAELARKFSPVTNARAGDVPADGTPRRQAEAAGTGSTLPVVAASRSIPDTGDLWSGLVEQGRILEPPYDPWLLVCAVDESDTLPQCVDVMARNIGGHGVELDPLFDTRDAVTGAELEPPPEAQAERAELQLWLAGVNVPGGLPGILDLADRDCETVGWGCVEVMRDSAGRVADLGHVPAYTVRLSPEDPPVLVDRTVRHPGTGELVTVRRWARFRRFCQLKEGRTVWFKAFGDPRHVNWLTGEVRQADAGPWGVDTLGNSLEATELVYVRIYHPATPYGVPRWIGAVPHVRASRNAAELIVDWFDNAPIGVKLAIIAGGRWKDGALDTLQDQIEQSTRGRRNAWNVVGLEGEAGSAGGRDPLDETRDAPARHSLEDLTTEIPAGLYLGRDSLIDRSSVRVRAMFRLGAIYFGDSEGESNRAAADTARAIGEEQVFRPLRAARWETLLNGQVLPGLGVNWWRLTLQGATTADDTEGIGRALGALVQGGGASPNSLAKLYSTLTGQAVELVAESWGDRPLALTLALLAAGLDPNKPLSELAAEVATKAQAAEEAAQAQAAAAAKVAAGAGAGGAPPADGEPPPDGGLARKALAVHELLDLRGALVDQLRAEGGDELAGALAGLPTSWTDHG